MSTFKESASYKTLRADLAGIQDPASELPAHFLESKRFLARIPDAAAQFAYQSGKWTVSQVVGHVVDTQILLLYRALAFARGDRTALPGNNENVWAAQSGHAEMRLDAVAAAYHKAAELTDWMVRLMPRQALDRVGVANNLVISVEEILLYLIGHERHHWRILRERYGVGLE